jgi:hypothetical protein
MKIRLVKTHKKDDGSWYYRVDKRHFIFGWCVYGNEFWSASHLSLKEAEDLIDDLIQEKKYAGVIKEVNI